MLRILWLERARVLLIGMWVQLLRAVEPQANKLPDSMDAGEPINWPINNN